MAIPPPLSYHATALQTLQINKNVVEFYSDLAELIKSIPKHNVVLTGGDMDAKIGQIDSTGSAFHNTTNRNGQHLLIS